MATWVYFAEKRLSQLGRDRLSSKLCHFCGGFVQAVYRRQRDEKNVYQWIRFAWQCASCNILFVEF